jgi:hypothetical protein
MPTATVRALAAAAALLFVVSTYAQQPSRIRGQIEKADGAMLSLKTREGGMVNVKVADDARMAWLVKASLADVKNDMYVGIAGVPQPDGSVEAFSIHVLLPAARGNGEGERPWDARPNSTMTNAYVESVVDAKDGQTLMVKSKDGAKKVTVTPSTVIATLTPANKGDLKAGEQIIIMASEKQPDGSVLAKAMYIGRDIVPAM